MLDIFIKGENFLETKNAILILSALANGVDPYTGEVLPENGPYHNPDTIRALFMAIKGLDLLQTKEKRSSSLPANVGKRWTPEEDEKLCNGFDKGMTIRELALEHARTSGAIKSRLVHLGKIDLDTYATGLSNPNRLPSAEEEPWKPEEDEQLSKDYDAGISIKELSQKYGRNIGSIQSRLLKLGKKIF